MIKSLHIGRYVATPAQFQKIAKFLEAIGLQLVPGSRGSVSVFGAAGVDQFQSTIEFAIRAFAERLKDMAKLIVLEVSNPDDVLAIAQKMKIKVLGDLSISQ